MIIYVDADACPKPVKEILYRTAERLKINTKFVANQYMSLPQSDFLKNILVEGGPDSADDKIVELVEKGDLVITADIPLADRVIEKDTLVINPHGRLYTKDDIKYFLSKRNFFTELRKNGVETGGSPPFSKKETTAFANQLDRILTKLRNKI
jgi:uncharacterized protein YaiI (UPF0178 family)